MEAALFFVNLAINVPSFSPAAAITKAISAIDQSSFRALPISVTTSQVTLRNGIYMQFSSCIFSKRKLV